MPNDPRSERRERELLAAKLLLERQERLARSRAKSNANLRPFTSEDQPPGHRKSRKGKPNKATIYKLFMKEFEKQERRLEKRRTKKEKASLDDWQPITWDHGGY